MELPAFLTVKKSAPSHRAVSERVRDDRTARGIEHYLTECAMRP